MPKFEFCIPGIGKAVPSGEDWFHQVKYDGYRLRIERQGRQFANHARRLRFDQALPMDLPDRAQERAQAVRHRWRGRLGADGVWDFSALHSGKQNSEVVLCAFDAPAIDGEDVRDRYPRARRILSRLQKQA